MNRNTIIEEIDDEFQPTEEEFLTGFIRWDELAELLALRGERIVGFIPGEEGIEYKVSLRGQGH